jgi:uncharacterized protein
MLGEGNSGGFIRSGERALPRLNTDTEIRQLIDEARTIAVVGISPKEHRDSHRVARYLREHGFRIIPVNPNAQEIFGERCYPSLADIPGEVAIDIVDVFRRPDAVEPIARDAVTAGARAIWFQIGVINEDAAEIASQGGLDVVMDRCLMVDHGRLLGGA